MSLQSLDPCAASNGKPRLVPGDRYADWSPVVTVPARDEEQRIPALIQALGEQSWQARHGRRLDVVIVLNNCSDRSKQAAARAATHYPSLRVELVEVDFPATYAHVGSARRLAAREALLSRPASSRSVIMTTDADAMPDPTWVESNLRAIEAGADIVGGLIIGDKDEESRLGSAFLRRAELQLRYARLVDHLAALIDPLPYDPWPRHSDHTGASLAIRGDVYAAVGGFPKLPFREDLALVSRARAAGYRVRHPLDVRVKVSARLEGRAPGGMADCLKGWIRAESEGDPHLAEAPEAVAARFFRRRALRVHPGRPHSSDPAGIAALIESLVPDEPDAVASVPIDTALARIRAMVADAQANIRSA
jgi:hypothetical protein